MNEPAVIFSLIPATFILIRQKRLVRRFGEAGATDREHAVTLETLRESRSWIFNQMARQGVFMPVPGGYFYMDQSVADEFLRQRWKRALVILACLPFVWLFMWHIGYFGK